LEAHDINKNESNTGLQHLKKFAQRHIHTNPLIAKPLHRHDLQDTSCINEEVKRYNRKMQKMIKAMQHITIVDS
jgi:hypothetical protein